MQAPEPQADTPQTAHEALCDEIKRLRGDNLSQARLAKLTGYTRAYMSMAENKASPLPSREVIHAIDIALNAGGKLDVLREQARAERDKLRRRKHQPHEQSSSGDGGAQSSVMADRRLVAGSAPGQESEREDMKRRALLRLVSLAATLVAAPPTVAALDPERIEHAAEHDSTIEGDDVDQYELLNSTLWSVFALSKSKADVYPLVINQLDDLIDGLKRAADEVTRNRLHVLTGDLCQLAGEICFDANQYDNAATCYNLAASASKEAGNFDLWATAITRLAFTNLYEREFSDAEHLLDAALRVAQRGDSQLSTRHWVSAVRAQALAGQGKFDDCMRALDQAEQVSELVGEVQNGGWLRFDGSRLPEERGACLVELRRPDLAEKALVPVLSSKLTSRRRGGVLTDLALIGAQCRDPDRLIAYADEVLTIVRRTGSGVVGRKLVSLQDSLGPFLSDSRVRKLNQDISALGIRGTESRR